MGFLRRRSEPTTYEFAGLMMEMLRQVGDDRVANYEPGEFRIVFTRDGARAGMMHLSNLYTEYCATRRTERSAMLRRTCLGLIRKFEIPDDFADVMPDILPTVRVRSTEAEMRLDQEIAGGEWEPFASLPLSEHLEICLVYDMPERMEFLTRKKLDELGVSLFEAAEIAKQNLAEREFTIGAIDEKLFVVVAGDAYDATRMLLLDPIRALPLVGQPIVMPVNRDSLMIVGSDDAHALGIMAALTEKKLAEPRSLCLIPHILLGDEWLPWMPPPEHPHYDQFRMLSLKHYHRDYSEQKNLLDKLHEKTGEDVFVASFSAMERDGQVSSYCVWSKGVLTWLPLAEHVALYDPDTEENWLVRWDRLQTVADRLLSPLDCYPPRWLVDGFPSGDEIDAMQRDEVF